MGGRHASIFTREEFDHGGFPANLPFLITEIGNPAGAMLLNIE